MIPHSEAARARESEPGALLSPSQREIFFVHHLTPGAGVYNLFVVLRLAGELEVGRLRRFAEGLIRQQDALRTAFVLEAGSLRASIVEPTTPPVPSVDLRRLPPERVMGALGAAATAEIRRAFDLARPPLLRLLLVRTGRREHRLVVTFHHIVSDAWSRRIVVTELARHLTTGDLRFVSPRPEPEPRPPPAIRDEPPEESAAEERLPLPYDRPARDRYRFDGARHHFAPLRDRPGALDLLARRAGVTPFIVLLAALQALLYRDTGCDRFSTGTPTTERSHSRDRHRIGYFVRMLRIPARVAGDPTFADLTGRVRGAVREARSRPPPGSPPRPAGSTSQVVLTLDKEIDVRSGPALRIAVENLELDPGTARFELALQLTRTARGLEGFIEFAADRFDRTTIHRLADRFERLLGQVASDPELRLDELRPLSPAERQMALHEWNDTTRAPTGELTVADLFRATARGSPDSVALETDGTSVSYGELDRRACHLAAALRERGVGPDVLVAVSTRSSLEGITGLVAVLLAGGAYLPLDPELPERRLRFLVRDAGARFLLAEPQLLRALPPGVLDGLEVIDPPSEPATTGRGVPTEIGRRTGADGLVYVSYTSGSTGTPKPVAVSHGNVVRLVHRPAYVRLGPGETFFHLAPLSFDASTFEIWGPLLNGGRLVLPGGGEPSIARILELVHRFRVTTLWLTAGLFHRVVEAGAGELRGLQQLLAGGDVLSPAAAAAALHGLDGGTLINGYGPTESTTFACCGAVTPGRGAASIPIGRPITETRALVLDRRFRAVPMGVRGELCIGGTGLARGYPGRPARTAERFVPDPFGRRPGDRLYRTGDLVRHLADGRIEFHGRLDRQVKVRGFRIEPGEIETVLESHPRVRRAVVTAAPDATGERRLVAYVTGREVTADALRRHLSARLPAPLRPGHFILLDELPLTENGKVDRSRLPAPETTRPPPLPTARPPLGPVEAAVADAWRETLGAVGFGRDDDFFEVGGQSLALLRVVHLLERRFRTTLGPRRLSRDPTVRGMARCVERVAGLAPGESTDDPPPEPRAADGSAERVLSYAQERLWYLSRLAPESTAYVISRAYRIRGPLDPAALSAAVTGVAARHEVLRTTVASAEGRPYPVVGPVARPAVARIDLGRIPAPRRRAVRERLLVGLAATGFDLEASPPLRAYLLRLSGREHVLMLTLHHIAADEDSMRALARDLAALYEAHTASGAAPPPAVPFQYSDFAVWQRARWEAGRYRAALERQCRRLAGCTPLAELTSQGGSSTPMGRGAVERISLPSGLSSRLEAFARAVGGTPFMVLLAAVAALLHRWSGRTDLPIGIPVSGREIPALDPLAGCFVNTVVIRADLAGDPPFSELAVRVRERTLEALEDQAVPFDRLVHELEPARLPDGQVLFNVLFNLRDATASDLELAGLRCDRLPVPRGDAQLDLAIVVERDGRSLGAHVEYRVDRFDALTVRRMTRQLSRFLDVALREPGGRLSQLDVLTPAERHLLLHELAPAPAAPCGAATVTELVEAGLRRSPDAVAVVWERGAVTREALDRRAGALAGDLVRLGIGRGDRVAVLSHRAPAAVVALVAVLRAGGVYVPLEPGSPRVRLAHVLEDSDASAVIAGDDLVGLLPEGSPPVVRVARDGTRTSGEAGEPRAARPPCGADLAYIVYTSGSTGRPKGVVVAQAPLAQHLLSWLERGRPGTDDAGAHYASLAFDACLEGILLDLVSGARLALPEDPTPTAAELSASLERQRVTRLTLPTSLWRVLSHELTHHVREPDVPPPRSVVAGGEAMSAESAAAWHRWTGGGCELLNAFGTTESVITSTVRTLAGDDLEAGRGAPPVGRPLAGVSVHVLDRSLLPTPLGGVGELCIAGRLATGYHRSPGLTAQRFVADPGDPVGGGRLYRTGDLARWSASGALTILGRLDHQVKIRGYRVEPGEVEAAIRLHPQVRDVVVVPRPDRNGAAQLQACVLPEPPGDETLDLGTFRTWLEERLPPYLVPGRFVRLDAIPRTAGGKVDRRALAELEGDPAIPGDRSRKPSSETEELLLEVWREVLGTDEIGVGDDFFALGGDSLEIIRVVSRAGRRGFGFTAAQLLAHPTIEALARVGRWADRATLPVHRPEARTPLGPSQQWLLGHDLGNLHHWNLAVLLTPEPELRADTLAAALGAVTECHQTLRLRLSEEDGERWQSFPPGPGPGPLAAIDLSALPPDRGVPTLEEAADRLQSSLDLHGGPPGRAALFLLPAADRRLLLVFHHMVLDGVSLHVVLRDLDRACRRLERGDPVALPHPPTAYGDWTRALARWTTTTAAQRAASRWLALPWRRLRPLPVDLSAGVDDRGSAGRLGTVLDPTAHDLLHRLCTRESAGPGDVLAAALAVALARWSGHRYVLVALVLHGREAELDGLGGADLSRTVGWLSTVVPALFEVPAGGCGRTYLRTALDTVGEATRHGVAFGALRHMGRGTDSERLARTIPAHEVSFNYLGRLEASYEHRLSSFRPANEPVGRLYSSRGRRPSLLAVSASQRCGETRMGWVYGRTRHRPATLHGLARGVERALEWLAGDPPHPSRTIHRRPS